MVKILSIIAGVVVILAGGIFFFNRQFANKIERTKFQVREQVREVVEPIFDNAPTLPPSESAKILTGGTHVFQTFNNCGPASLSMALSYYGIKASQHELGDILRPYQVASGDNDDKTTTFAEMDHLAQTYGFTIFVRPNGNSEIVKNFINLGIPVIAKTWTKPNEDIGHFRVIKGYDDVAGTFVQDDSLQGKNLTYSYEDFNVLWEAFGYQYLVLVPSEKVEMAKVILGEDLDESVAWEKLLASDTAEFNKLVSLYRLGRYQEAVGVYERIKDSLPRRMLWYQIEPILAYQKVGSYDKVFEITNHLIENGNRAFSEAYQIRGEIYESQGKTEEAKAEFEKVLMYNKNFYKYWQ
jgi:tetratricopeptide (TPR) repeat protein